MRDTTANPWSAPGSLEREFDRALELLDARFAAMERAIRRYSAASLEAREAEKAYDLARLVLLSCDLRLRSLGITRPTTRRRLIHIIAYSPLEPYRRSLTLVLRAYGYRATPAGTVRALRAALREQRCAAVVFSLAQPVWREPLILEGVIDAAQHTPIFVLQSDATSSGPSAFEHARIRCVASIESLVAQLDEAIEADHASAPSASVRQGYDPAGSIVE